jgi:multiple sugar transport system permease protein
MPGSRFRHVTLPILSPVIFFNLVMGVIGAMKVFDQAYVFGAAMDKVPGGPARATLFYVLHLFQTAFNYFPHGPGQRDGVDAVRGHRAADLAEFPPRQEMGSSLIWHRTRLQNIILYGTLIAGSFIMLIPLAWMIVTSLKTFPEAMADPPVWIPEKPQWENYRTALGDFPLLRLPAQFALVTSLNVAGTLVSCTMAAYAFACLNFKYKNVVFGLLMSRHDAARPGHHHSALYVLCEDRLGEHLPAPPGAALARASNVFGIFLLRQFFLTIPRDYIEAARMDGANEWTILWRVYVPLSTPVLMTVTVFSFLASWNDLWGPLIFLHDESLYTMPIGLLNFIAMAGQAQGTPWQLVMAVSTIMVIPIVIIFFLAQKRFIEGIASHGVKG